MKKETFTSAFKVLINPGYLEVAQNSFARKRAEEYTGEERADEERQEASCDAAFMEALAALKKGDMLENRGFEKKEGETSRQSVTIPAP